MEEEDRMWESSDDSSSGEESAEEEQEEREQQQTYRVSMHRRVGFLVNLSALMAVCCFGLSGTPGHITASYRRQRMGFDIMIGRMTERLFIRSFRMNLPAMQDLFSLVADDLYRDPAQACRSSGSPIYPQLRLAMALRFLAGGSYLDISVLYGVSPEGFYESLWMVLASLVRHVAIQFSMRAQDCANVAAGFLRRQRRHVFRGVVGALDGILIKTKRPTMGEYAKPAQFWCRKQFYSLNVQAICDAARIFLFVAIDCPASVHDSLAFSMSTLGRYIDQLPAGYYLVADAAYKAIPRCLVPFEGRGGTEGERNFSFYQSSLRINVECAFGMLIRRWGVLWRPLQCSLMHNILIVQACFAMHNWCQRHRAPIPVLPPRGRGSARLNDRPVLDDQGRPADLMDDEALRGARTNMPMAALRREMVAEMEELNMRRPVPSMGAQATDWAEALAQQEEMELEYPDESPWVDP